jgi:hypothetical protein
MAMPAIPAVIAESRGGATPEQRELLVELAAVSARAEMRRWLGAGGLGEHARLPKGYTIPRNAMIAACLENAIPRAVVAKAADLSGQKVRDAAEKDYPRAAAANRESS